MGKSKLAEIGKFSPDPVISECVQGNPSDFVIKKGKIVLIEVFQVNCPWCFIFGIPEAIQIHETYFKDNVKVLGIATAFEDFGINTLDNLKLLVNEQKVVGNTHKKLRQFGKLDKNGKFPHRIPFPVAMDNIIPRKENNRTTYDYSIDNLDADTSHVQKTMETDKHLTEIQHPPYFPCTFTMFGLSGTPSSIIVDSKGILQHVILGNPGTALAKIKEILV